MDVCLNPESDHLGHMIADCHPACDVIVLNPILSARRAEKREFYTVERLKELFEEGLAVFGVAVLSGHTLEYVKGVHDRERAPVTQISEDTEV